MTRGSWIIVAATVVLSNFASAAEWPQFRGPNSSGIGDGKPPVEFGPSQNVLWKMAVGSGLSSPIIAKGRVLLTEFDRATKQLATLCIDQRTGKVLWRRTIAPSEIEKVHEISSPAAPTPATDGERIYVYFGSDGLLSYDFDGKLLWGRRLPLSQNNYGAVASPICAPNLIGLNQPRNEASLPRVNDRAGR